MGTLRFLHMHLRVPFLLLAPFEFCVRIVAVFVAVYVRYETWPAEVDDIRSPYSSGGCSGTCSSDCSTSSRVS